MPKDQRERRVGDTARSVYQLKVTLLHSQPPIWRRVQVESGVTFDRLHDTLQIVMGWTNSLPGYYRFLEAIKDPKHPEHEDMMEWAGKDFAPATFDVQELNRAFHGGWGPRSRTPNLPMNPPAASCSQPPQVIGSVRRLP